MANYSFREKADVIFMYDRTNGNDREAARLYQESFPDQQQPSIKFLLHCINDLQRLARNNNKNNNIY